MLCELFHSDTKVRFCLKAPQVQSQTKLSHSKASLCERSVRRYRCISETCCFVWMKFCENFQFTAPYGSLP